MAGSRKPTSPRVASLWTFILAAPLACFGAGLAAQPGGTAATARAPGENPDAALASGAAQHGIAAVELSQLAARAASAPAVRRFARSMVDAQIASNRRLMLIAARENIDLPRALDDEHGEMVDALQQLTGPAFDQAYLDALVADQRRMLGLLESGQATVSTQELRTYIRTTLPGVRSRLDRAQSLQR